MRKWYPHPQYLALTNDNQIVRVPSWLAVVGWIEIPATNHRYYNEDGSIRTEYQKNKFYLSVSGRKTLSPR